MKKYWKVLSTGFLLSALLVGCSSTNTTKPADTPKTTQTAKKEPTIHPDYNKYKSVIDAVKKATEKYKDITVAVKEGYIPVSGFVPNMGYHFQNLSITTFDVNKPSILLYSYENGKYILVGVEWGTTDPTHTKSPIDSMNWAIVHKASAHYADGNELEAKTKADAPLTYPKTGAKMILWHPDIYGIHVYTERLNPNGPFANFNPSIPSSGEPLLPPGYEKYITSPEVGS